jgi:hypothetical protein
VGHAQKPDHRSTDQFFHFPVAAAYDRSKSQEGNNATLIGRRHNKEPAACDRFVWLGRFMIMNKKVTGKDLTKEPPRSPRIRVGGYAILGRTIDKCRALVGGNIGEYHFDCPLDNTLFGFKGVKGDDFKAQIEQGASDQELVEWLNRSGEKKTPDEIRRWAEEVEAGSLYNDPEKRDFFSEEAKKLGLDPAKTTTFEWLELDDKVSHTQAAA